MNNFESALSTKIHSYFVIIAQKKSPAAKCAAGKKQRAKRKEQRTEGQKGKALQLNSLKTIRRKGTESAS